MTQCYETASKKHFFKEKEKLKQWGSTKKKPLQKMKDKLKLEQVTAEKSSEVCYGTDSVIMFLDVITAI